MTTGDPVCACGCGGWLGQCQRARFRSLIRDRYLPHEEWIALNPPPPRMTPASYLSHGLVVAPELPEDSGDGVQTPAMEHKFKVGDVVQLKSGGPQMTIDAVHPSVTKESNSFTCVWFGNTTELKRSIFSDATLRLLPTDNR